jgi:hypothetical protein
MPTSGITIRLCRNVPFLATFTPTMSFNEEKQEVRMNEKDEVASYDDAELQQVDFKKLVRKV